MKPLCTLLIASLPASALAQSGVYDHRGTAGDEFGTAIASLGDMDGDGIGDYAVGAPHGTGLQPDSGYVIIYSGRTGATIRKLDGEVKGDLFGWSLDGFRADIDGDLVNDLIVGAPGHNTWGGKVYVISGASGSTISAGVAPSGMYGWSVAAGFDATGDQIADFAVSLPTWSGDMGAIIIRSGATMTSVRSYFGELPGDQFGYSLDTAGDVNNDGRGDLVVGAPGYDRVSGIFTYPNAGRAYVVSGGGDQVIYHHTGWVGLSAAGTAVAGGEDVDGDGVPDIAVGLPGVYATGPLSGRVEVVKGGGSHAIWYQLNGEAAGDSFGSALDMIPDSDGDGRGDLVVGAPDADSGGNVDAGWGYVYSGVNGNELYRMNGYYPGDRMGGAVASARLLNSDGAGDVIFGAPHADHPTLGADSGWARPSLGAAPYPTTYCQGKVNSAGCTPHIGSVGVASLSIADNCHVQAAEVLPNKPGMMIWSYEQKASPFYGGTLCVKAPIVRTPVQNAAQIGPGPCDGRYSFHLSHAYMASKNVPAGVLLNAQYWSRDSGFAPPNGIGLTNGLAITVIP